MRPRFSLVAVAMLATAAAAEPALRYQVPATVSPEAAKTLTSLYGPRSHQPALTRPSSVADWDRRRETFETRLAPMAKSLAARLGVTSRPDRIGGVPVLRIRPANWRATGRTLIYLHGGAYTFFSAASDLGPPALVAAATGDEVVSVDYTVAPRGTWRVVTDQVLSVWRALLAGGVAPRSVGVFGDSAGGALAAGSVLKMRDHGLPLPGALYLLSPWSDITATGDTYQTLAGLDPTLDVVSLGWSADVYAEPSDQKNPYVSPVYGDYRKAFPPTLIQGGTREIFLSNFVRQYQAIRSGGHEAVLDLYEGMPHVFQAAAPDSPESRTAIARAAVFFSQHLGRR